MLCILHSHIATSKSILVHATDLQKQLCLELHEVEALEVGFQQQIVIIEGHIRRVEGLLQSCTFTARMKVFQLLSFRNDHEQRMKLGLIDDRLWVAANETQKIVASTRQTSTDSRASLISSLFSLAYLPAGIVAVNVPRYPRWVGSLRKKSLTFCVRLCSVATLLNSAPD